MRKPVAMVAAIGLGIATAMVQAVSEPASALKPEALTLDQTTRLATIITNQNAAPVPNASLSVSIDSVVPQQIELRPLPSSANEVAPQFKGYSYVIVEEEIRIVDHRTRKQVGD